ncbi:ISAon1 family transposase N-terminal region protein [Labilibacter marinus]|uniref:ISAon1 family transposase N-terminal region protein n=1 Tax=Labilibacter marinus TaxID=1477105 RepID=UPI000832A77A|nr:hypothetical protein [Labilibacter marinus]
MSELSTQLLELILPEGILDYFIITDFKQEKSGQELYTKHLTIYLEEKQEIPQEYSHYKHKASGFMNPKEIRDCPIRRNLVTLNVKRRRWDIEIDGKQKKVSRDWESVAKGTRLDPEYASFLKAIGGL